MMNGRPDIEQIREWAEYNNDCPAGCPVEKEFDNFGAVLALCDYAEDLEKGISHLKIQKAMLRELVEADDSANVNCDYNCNNNCPYCMRQLGALAKAKAMLTPADSGKEESWDHI